MIPPKTNYNIAPPTLFDFTEAEFNINEVLYNRDVNTLNTYKRFSPDWYNIFNQKAHIAYGITYETLMEYKDRYTFQDIPKLDRCAEKLDKINHCVGKTHLFFLKAINLIDSIKENINLLQSLKKCIPSLRILNDREKQATITFSTTGIKKATDVVLEKPFPQGKSKGSEAEGKDVTIHLSGESLSLDVTERNQTKQKKKPKGVPKKFTFSGAEIYTSGLTVQKSWVGEHLKRA